MGKQKMVASRTLRAGILLSLSLLGVGCSPAINAFHVQPETYCPSTRHVRIAWDATGDTTVAPSPDGDAFHEDKGDVRVCARAMSVSIEAYKNHRKAGHDS
jgi:hypothetical protein